MSRFDDPVQQELARAKRIKNFKSRHEKRKTAIITAILVIVCALFLIPIVLTITNSFMTKGEIASNYGVVFATDENSKSSGKTMISDKVNLKFIPDKVSFSQYVTVLFKSPEYLYKFWNSVILVVPIVLFQTLISVMAAYGLSRYRSKWKEVVFFIYLILMLMPYQVTLVPNYLVSHSLHLINTYWSIWLPGIFSPFAVYMLTKYIRRIPTAVIEAACIDGCTEWQVFWKVCFPLSKGAMASVAILLFIDYWNMVEQPIVMLTDENKYPLSVFLSKVSAGDIGLAFALASIYMMLPLLIFLYGEDYLVEGISFQGGVKG